MAGKLTARKVQTVTEPGMHSDGLGLYLCVSAGGSKSWILRTTVKGRCTASGNPYRVEIGLGSVADVSLAKAREEASPLRATARRGINPLDERRRQMLTFEEAARNVYNSLLPTWRNEKHAQTWWSTVDKHANARFECSDLTIEALALGRYSGVTDLHEFKVSNW